MSSESLLRNAQPGDAGQLARIYSEAIRSRRSTMDTEPASVSYFEALLRGLGRREVLIVREAEGAVVGWGIVKRYSDRPGYARACETSVYVAERDQRRGHGASLLRSILKQAKELGYHHVVAKILAVNERSVRFHERHGFEIVGRQRQIGFLEGRPHDVVIMQRVFE